MNEMTLKPHVLLITVDHWPGSLLACAGHETILTPTIDEMASLDIYRDREIPDPYYGEWTGLARKTSQDTDEQQRNIENESCKDPARMRPQDIRDARRAFYAQCTHIDHQIRIVLGALRQEEMLQDTVVMFTSDHGDMLGNHGLWAKARFYEDSARVPMVLMGTQDDGRIPQGVVDDRIVGQQDILPTLLGLAGIDLPPHPRSEPGWY
jgi:arylsulfatase